MKIKKLSNETIMKIAAGEVITGTYAVVKELIENSIDSKATTVNIEILDGGKSLIKISDNGIGMTEEEISFAVQPHTTSKLNTIDDLYSLSTYGFRGEALSSICMVSRMSITSKTKDTDIATKINFIGGKEVNRKKIIANTGTIIEVEDLFFNVPARRKFLKSTAAEGRLITEIIEKFILSSNIGITYKRDNKNIYNIKQGLSLKEKVKLLFPELKEHELINLDKNHGWLKLKGIISNPKVTRFNRSAQFFFVNGRYVKSGELFSVFERGYGEMLEAKRHPYGVVFIDVNPNEVDVNVHPQKLEVKFSDTNKLLKLLKTSIREELDAQTNFKLEFFEESPEEVETKTFESYDLKEKENDFFYSESIKTHNNFNNESNTKVTNPYTPQFIQSHSEKPAQKEDIKKVFENKLLFTHNETKSIDKQPYRIVGIVAKRYIILEFSDKLKLIDFHAAHERVIFEKIKKSFLSGKINSKLLLTPIKLNLDKFRHEIMKEHIDSIKKLGIEIEINENTFYIKGVPAELKINDIKETVFELLDNFRLEGIESANKIYDDALSTMACRAAVKTGDDVVGIEKLIQNLIEMNLLTCPHGRPIAMDIDFNKLDTYFERK